MTWLRLLALCIAPWLFTGPALEAQISIVPSRAGNQSIKSNNQKFEAEGASLEQLLQFAYHLQSGCIVGPDWIRQQTYDVQGPRLELQPALIDRFHLSPHKETRTLDVYVLEATPGAEAKLKSVPANGPTPEGMLHTHAKGLISGSIANYLSSWLKLPVIDETSLTGKYDIDLTWNYDEPETLITSVARQLGLKLSKARRPVEVLVLDHASDLALQPAPNQ